MTLSGGPGGSKGKCHRMTQGGGRGLANVSRDIFSKILNYNNVFWPAFLKENATFLENQIVTSQRGGRGGGPCKCHQMTHGGGRGRK